MKVEWTCPFCSDDGWESIEGATHHLLSNHVEILIIIAQIWAEKARLKRE